MKKTMMGGTSPIAASKGEESSADEDDDSTPAQGPGLDKTQASAAPAQAETAAEPKTKAQPETPAQPETSAAKKQSAPKKPPMGTTTMGLPSPFQSTNAGSPETVRAPLGTKTLGLPGSTTSPSEASAKDATPRKEQETDQPEPPHAPVPAAKSPMGSTMLGMPSPVAGLGKDAPKSAEDAPRKEAQQKEPSNPEGSAPKAAFGRTMMGMPSPVAESDPKKQKQQDEKASPATKKGHPALGGTMLGMPSPLSGEKTPGPAGAYEESTPGPADPNTLRTPAGSPMHGTMVGMPSPVRSLTTEGGVAGGAPSADDLKHKTVTGMGQPELLQAAERSHGTKEPANPKFKGTLLGVAQPGIAPSHTAPAPPRSFDGSSHTPGQYPSSYPSVMPLSGSPPRPVLRSTIIVMVGLLVAAAIGGLLALLNQDPLTVAVQEFAVDEKGRDRLKLHCATCPDGSTLKLGSTQATVKNEQVVFLPDKPLSLGKNTLNFSLIDPSGQEKQIAPLVLPIAFRVRTDWETRQGAPPFGRVLVEAPAGSKVQIDGKAVPLVDGRAEYKVELGERTKGENETSERVAITLPVEVEMKKSTKSAKAKLKGVIAPLSLSSPGPVHRLSGQSVTFKGRSAPQASIKVAEQETVAAEDGTFRLSLDTPKADTLVVRAEGEHLIPRSVAIQLVETIDPPKNAASSYAQLKKGGEADFSGTVLESRIKDGVTQTLVDVSEGCTKGPCLVRLVYAEPKELREDSKVRIIGTASAGSPPTVRVTQFR